MAKSSSMASLMRFCHALPVALERLRVQARREILEAVRRQHRRVGAGGGVEGDLLLHLLLLLLDLRAGVPDDHHGRGAEAEVQPRAARRVEPLRHRRVEDFTQVLGGVEGVDVQAVRDLAREPGHVGIHPRQVDGDLRVLDGTRSKKGVMRLMR